MLVFHAFVTRLPTRFRPCLFLTCLLCLFPDPACPLTILPCLLSDPACTYVDRLACSLTLCPALTHLLPAVLWFVCLHIIRLLLFCWYPSALVLLPIKYITNTPWFLECCIWVLHKIVTVSVSGVVFQMHTKSNGIKTSNWMQQWLVGQRSSYSDFTICFPLCSVSLSKVCPLIQKLTKKHKVVLKEFLVLYLADVWSYSLSTQGVKPLQLAEEPGGLERDLIQRHRSIDVKLKHIIYSWEKKYINSE